MDELEADAFATNVFGPFKKTKQRPPRQENRLESNTRCADDDEADDDDADAFDFSFPPTKNKSQKRNIHSFFAPGPHNSKTPRSTVNTGMNEQPTSKKIGQKSKEPNKSNLGTKGKQRNSWRRRRLAVGPCSRRRPASAGAMVRTAPPCW